MLAWSAGAAEYTDCTSAEGYDYSNKSPNYGTKQADDEAQVMLVLLGMHSTPSLPSLSGTLLPGEVALDRALSMGQIKLNCVLVINWIV